MNIVCFRPAPGDPDEPAADRLDREAVRAIQQDGRTFVTGTAWNGRAAIRAAFDNWRTTEADVAILRAVVSDVMGRYRPGV